MYCLTIVKIMESFEKSYAVELDTKSKSNQCTFNVKEINIP